MTIFNLAALTDGRNPPNNPINTANINEEIIIPGDRANENANSAKLLKFKVEIEKNCKNEAITIPINPPVIAINKDSIRNTVKTLLLLKPSALNVPISTVRFAIAEYIVIIAPIVAPMLKIIVTNNPSNLISVAKYSD